MKKSDNLSSGLQWFKKGARGDLIILFFIFYFLDYSRHFHPALVHHADSSGGGAGSHCHQRPGGRLGKTRTQVFLCSESQYSFGG